jgi:hypothetical protein
MQADLFKKHFNAAQAALTQASKSGIAASTRAAWADVAQAETALCQLMLYYPDVTYGPLG